MSMKPQNSILQARGITNEIMLLYFQNVNKHEIFILSSKEMLLKRTISQINFEITFWFGLQKLLMELF